VFDLLHCSGELCRQSGNKTVPLRGRETLWSCETSRLQRFVDNWLTDGGEFVSLTRWSLFASQKYFMAPISVRDRVNARAMCSWKDGAMLIHIECHLLSLSKDVPIIILLLSDQFPYFEEQK
jgi:hypothetical protein